MADLNNPVEASRVEPNQVDTPVELISNIPAYVADGHRLVLGTDYLQVELFQYSDETTMTAVSKFRLSYKNARILAESILEHLDEFTTAAKNSPDTTTKAEKNANNPS